MYEDIVQIKENFSIDDNYNMPLNKKEKAIKYRNFKDIIGKSQELMKVIENAKVIANSPSTVLIEGESGTGKELLAKAIHRESDRSNKPFIVINCGAIPKELIESELFGYVDGAFTGAKKEGKIGKFELANGGTLFLDEIGELPIIMQVHFLRVLQEKTICRVGSSKEIKLDIRIIAATNRNLRVEVEKNNFREDLFYRLNVIPLKLPSLRERREDIPILINSFLQKKSQALKKRIPVIKEQLYEKLLNYSWPGNIRELENYIENIINLEGNMSSSILAILDNNRSIDKKVISEKKGFFIELDKNFNIKNIEKILIEKSLDYNNYNMSKTAKELGISRNTLYYKINKYNINH